MPDARPTQAQSDAICDILEANPAVVSLLRVLGARPIPEGAQDRSWERVKNQTGICPAAVSRSSGVGIDGRPVSPWATSSLPEGPVL
jgi:hypothetical protein